MILMSGNMQILNHRVCPISFVPRVMSIRDPLLSHGTHVGGISITCVDCVAVDILSPIFRVFCQQTCHPSWSVPASHQPEYKGLQHCLHTWHHLSIMPTECGTASLDIDIRLSPLTVSKLSCPGLQSVRLICQFLLFYPTLYTDVFIPKHASAKIHQWFR